MPKGVYLHQSPSRQTIEKRVAANRGQRRSLEIRQRMSEAQKRCGNKPPLMKWVKHSEAFRKKCSERRGEEAPWYGRHHSIETKQKLSELRRGERSSNWQGGITAPIESLRHTLEYRIWREAVFARDNWTCQECEQRGGRLHPHHVKSFAKYPALRFNIDNGKTLCKDCHKKTENFGGRAILETEMVKLDQIFMPYVITPSGKSLYEAIINARFQLVEGKGESEEDNVLH